MLFFCTTPNISITGAEKVFHIKATSYTWLESNLEKVKGRGMLGTNGNLIDVDSGASFVRRVSLAKDGGQDLHAGQVVLLQTRLQSRIPDL